MPGSAAPGQGAKVAGLLSGCLGPAVALLRAVLQFPDWSPVPGLCVPSRLLPVFAQRTVSKTKEKATITIGSLSCNDLEGNRKPVSMGNDDPVAGLGKEAGWERETLKAPRGGRCGIELGLPLHCEWGRGRLMRLLGQETALRTRGMRGTPVQRDTVRQVSSKSLPPR